MSVAWQPPIWPSWDLPWIEQRDPWRSQLTFATHSSGLIRTRTSWNSGRVSHSFYKLVLKVLKAALICNVWHDPPSHGSKTEWWAHDTHMHTRLNRVDRVRQVKDDAVCWGREAEGTQRWCSTRLGLKMEKWVVVVMPEIILLTVHTQIFQLPLWCIGFTAPIIYYKHDNIT